MSWYEFQRYKRFCAAAYGGDAGSWRQQRSQRWQQGHAASNGWVNGTDNQTLPGPCKCCGKDGHSRNQCDHKNKECTTCKKKGHLEAVCRHKKQSTNGGDVKAVNDKDGGKNEQSVKEPWCCLFCGCTNATTKERKCKQCKKLRPKNDETEEHEDKPEYSQSLTKLLDATDPEKLQEAIDKKEKEISFLQESTKVAKAWVQEDPLYQKSIDENSKRISALEGEIQKLKQPSSTKVSKNLLGELTKEQNNSDNKLRQIDEEIRVAKEAKNNSDLQKKADLEEAHQTYLTRKAFLENAMQEGEKHWDRRLKELNDKKKEAEEEARKKQEKLTDKMAERTLPEVKSCIKAATYAEVATAAGHLAEDVKVDAKVIEQHFFEDSSLTSVPAEHKDVLVASVERLVKEQMSMFMKQMDLKLKAATGKEDSSDDEDQELLPDGEDAGFTIQASQGKKEKQKQKKAAAAKAAAAKATAASATSTAAPSRMAVDQEQRKPSEKREAIEQGGREADAAELANNKGGNVA